VAAPGSREVNKVVEQMFASVVVNGRIRAINFAAMLL
jgi:hypothetical protein